MEKCMLAGDKERCPSAAAGHVFPVVNTPTEATECQEFCNSECAYCVVGEVQEDINIIYERIENTTNAKELLEINNEMVDITKEIEQRIEDKINAISRKPDNILTDTFESKLLLFESEDDGEDKKYRFKAITGQIDKANGNKRIYPKEELLRNMPRVERLMKSGRFTGFAGHPGMFDSGSPRDICVKFTGVELVDGDIIQSGDLVLTEAGKDMAILWDSGVDFEWSWRGYGELVAEDREKFDEDPWGYKGNFLVQDYIWEGTDAVVRGAARTKTVELTVDSQTTVSTSEIIEVSNDIIDTPKEEIIEASVIVTVDGLEIDETTPDSIEDSPDSQSEEIELEIDVEEKIEMENETPAVETVIVQAPAIDTSVMEAMVAAETEKQVAALMLRKYKEEKIASLGDENDFSKLIAKNIREAATTDDVDAICSVVAPKLAELKTETESPYSVAVINRQKTYENSLIVGDKVTNRPDNIAGVRSALTDGLSDAGGVGSPKWMFNKILDNYETFENGLYLHACTKRGFMETATTTTALGTTVPQVLPLLRKLFPMLISYEIATVQPINAPTARVYTLDTVIAGSSTSLSSSTTFDSTWADHTEGETKSQIAPKFTYSDIEVTEKAIYFDLTSALIQDMKALHNVDAEAELLREAANEIARELNYSFLELIRAGATASSQTFGTAKPTGYTSDLEWYQMLSLYIAKVGGKISEKVYTPANYLVVSPDVAPLLTATKDYIKFDVPTSYGAGLQGKGQFSSDYKVFVAEWFTANTILVIAKGDSWMKAGAVFAPYIPLFISPMDYVPSKNTLSRSVTSRNGQVVLNGSFYGTIVVEPGTTGVAPF
jgi:hypothetical protein